MLCLLRRDVRRRRLPLHSRVGLPLARGTTQCKQTSMKMHSRASKGHSGLNYLLCSPGNRGAPAAQPPPSPGNRGAVSDWPPEHPEARQTADDTD